MGLKEFFNLDGTESLQEPVYRTLPARWLEIPLFRLQIESLIHETMGMLQSANCELCRLFAR